VEEEAIVAGCQWKSVVDAGLNCFNDSGNASGKLSHQNDVNAKAASRNLSDIDPCKASSALGDKCQRASPYSLARAPGLRWDSCDVVNSYYLLVVMFIVSRSS